MSESTGAASPPPNQRFSRRRFVGGTLAAASLAVAYSALADPLGVFDDDAGKGDVDAIRREDVKISHLLRRAGFGLTREEHDYYQSIGLKATQEELLDFASIDDSEAVKRAEETQTVQGNRVPSLWWLARLANTRRPLQEKMVLFWHGLLTSQLSVVRDPEAMIAQNEFFRAHAFDSFPNLLQGISKDAAMMVYLDMDGSNRTAPNENYARELMELFALGEGNYSEQDVREAARAFTGWQVPRVPMAGGRRDLGEPVFRPQRFDSGSKTFLGKTGSFRPEDIVAIVAEQPAAGVYITRRLYTFFVHPDPQERDLKPFVAEYERSGGNIGAVMAALLRSDAFYSPRAYRAMVKSPLEYAIGALKALGLQGNAAALVASGNVRGGGPLGEMGQVPFEPPNVAGWPGNRAWLNSATMLARLNLINAMTGGNFGRQPRQRAQPDREQARPAPGPDLGTAAQAFAHYLPLVLDDNLPPDARAALLEYAGGDQEAALSADQLRGLAYLIFASPQFHLS
jgi:uncharacterized protein (DUF1800 family)